MSVYRVNLPLLNFLTLCLTDKTDEAIAAYEKTLKLSPRHTTALTSLARIYRQQGHNDRAEETFKRSEFKLATILAVGSGCSLVPRGCGLGVWPGNEALAGDTLLSYLALLPGDKRGCCLLSNWDMNKATRKNDMALEMV